MDRGCGWAYVCPDERHVVTESGTDVTAWGWGGGSCCRQKAHRRVRTCQVSRLFFNQVPVINVPTDKRRVIPVITSRLNSDEEVIMIGPAILNDVRMALRRIQETTSRFSVIWQEDCDA